MRHPQHVSAGVWHDLCGGRGCCAPGVGLDHAARHLQRVQHLRQQDSAAVRGQVPQTHVWLHTRLQDPGFSS